MPATKRPVNPATAGVAPTAPRRATLSVRMMPERKFAPVTPTVSPYSTMSRLAARAMALRSARKPAASSKLALLEMTLMVATPKLLAHTAPESTELAVKVLTTPVAASAGPHPAPGPGAALSLMNAPLSITFAVNVPTDPPTKKLPFRVPLMVAVPS